MPKCKWEWRMANGQCQWGRFTLSHGCTKVPTMLLHERLHRRHEIISCGLHVPCRVHCRSCRPRRRAGGRQHARGRRRHWQRIDVTLTRSHRQEPSQQRARLLRRRRLLVVLRHRWRQRCVSRGNSWWWLDDLSGSPSPAAPARGGGNVCRLLTRRLR